LRANLSTGREADLRSLRGAIDLVWERGGSSGAELVLSGFPGAGKSALLRRMQESGFSTFLWAGEDGVYVPKKEKYYSF